MNSSLYATLLLVLTACSVLVPPTPTDSGIEGQVLIGPVCPVVQFGTECPDQPYQADLSVFNLRGEKIVKFRVDENGQFRIPLPPGKYILHPESPGPMPYAEEQSFTVLPGQFTQIIDRYDSCIR